MSSSVMPSPQLGSPSNVSLISNDNILTPTNVSESAVSTPSAKRKRAPNNTPDRDKCRKCQVQHGSRTDNDFNSIWINCSHRRCDYWVHCSCLGLVVKEENEENFAPLFHYYCPVHNPKKIPTEIRKKSSK